MATGVAFLPTIAMIMAFSQLSNIVLMPRTGPKPLVAAGMLVAAAPSAPPFSTPSPPAPPRATSPATSARAIAASRQAESALQAAAAVHGYTTAFWWMAGLFTAGAIVCGSLFRRGPLSRTGSGRRRPERRGA